jgi:hypothetical protein
LLPRAARVAVLVNSSENTTIFTTRDVQEAARTMALQVNVINAATGREIDEAFARMGREGPMRCSSGPTSFSTAGGCRLPSWRRATGFRRRSPCATMSKPAGS